MVVITLLYVVATLFICYYNKKSANAAVVQAEQAKEQAKEDAARASEQAEQAQKMMKKTIDIQLYDKMLAISNNIEKDDYTNTIMEVSVMFGNQIWKQIENIKEQISELQEWKRKQERYNQLCEEQGYDESLAQEAEMEGASEDIIHKAMAQDEKFAVVYDYETYMPEYGIEAEEYNWKEISSQIKILEEQVSKEQKQLKRDVYNILKSKITVD